MCRKSGGQGKTWASYAPTVDSQFFTTGKIDEDFTAELVHVTADSVSSAPAIQKKILDGGRTDNRRLHWNKRGYRRAQMSRVYEKSKSVTIIDDGSNIGKPAEDTVMYAMFVRQKTAEGANHFGTWMMPQVITHEKMVARKTVLSIDDDFSQFTHFAHFAHSWNSAP